MTTRPKRPTQRGKISLEKQSQNFPQWEASPGKSPPPVNLRHPMNIFSVTFNLTFSLRGAAILLYVLHLLGFL